MTTKKKSNAGAKTKYHPDFPLLAEGFARQGLTDKQIIAKLGLSNYSFYEYQKKYPEFYDALKRGKAPVDVEVENALLKRARGYEYEEETFEYKSIPPIGKDGKQKEAVPTSIKKVTKQVVPDTTAQIFWLKNRRPDLWRDKQELGIGGNKEKLPIEIIFTDANPHDKNNNGRKGETEEEAV